MYAILYYSTELWIYSIMRAIYSVTVVQYNMLLALGCEYSDSTAAHIAQHSNNIITHSSLVKTLLQEFNVRARYTPFGDKRKSI